MNRFSYGAGCTEDQYKEPTSLNDKPQDETVQRVACTPYPKRHIATLGMMFAGVFLLLFLCPLAWVAAGSKDEGEGGGKAIAIRLVDANDGAPLEYWLKEQDLPEGGRLVFCMPTTVYVDGKALEFGVYGAPKGDAMDASDKGHKDKEGDLGNIVSEMGGGGFKEPNVNSDRKNEVLGAMGVKALVSGEFGPGEHVIEPGGVKFTVDAKGALSAGSASFGVQNATAGALACWPVDINLVGGPTAATKAQIKIASGGKAVVDKVIDVLKGVAAIRVYLPLGSEYTVTVSGMGTFGMAVEKTAVKLADKRELSEGFGLTAKGFVVSLQSPARAFGTADQKHPQASTPGGGAETGAPEAAEAEVYLFTDRNRQVYLEGERVGVSLRAYGPAAKGPAVLKLQEIAKGAARDLASVPLRADGAGGWAEFELDTALLRPGKYDLVAQSGSAASNPLPLEVASAMPATDMKLLGYSKWGSESYEPATLSVAKKMGMNMLSQDMGRKLDGLRAWSMRELPSDPQRFKEFQKAHFPKELLDVPIAYDRGTEWMLANGIENMPDLAPNGLILYCNVGPFWMDHAEDRYQSIQHWAQGFRRFPNTTGFVYCSGDGPTPATMGFVWASAGVASFDVIHDQRMKKLRELFEKSVGKIDVDESATTQQASEILSKMDGAIGFGVGMESKVKISGDDDKKFAWFQWINDLYPDNFRHCRDALSPLIAEPVVNCGTSWGQGAGGGMYCGTFYRSLDNPIIDHHGDYGQLCFSNVSGSDCLMAGLEDRTQRSWEMLDLIRERHNCNGFALFLEALSRNPAGIGVFQLNADEVAGAWGKYKDKSEALMTITDLAKRFGDVFMNLQRKDEIAVVASLRQAAVGGQGFARVWGSHYLIQKAGFQATIIDETYCVKHAAELAGQYKALFLPEFDKPLAGKFREAVEAFQKAGGVVIGDANTIIDLTGLVTVPVAADMKGTNINDHWKMEQQFAPMIQQFNDIVRPKLKSFFTTSSAKFSVIRSFDGDLEYWTVFNDGKDESVGVKNGVAYQFTYRGDKAAITAAKGGTLYDAFRREAVAAKATEGGGVGFECDMTQFPGTVYVLAPRPIEKLEVACSKQVAPGQLVKIRASAKDGAGAAFTGRLPVEVTVTDPNSTVRYQVYRTTNTDLEFKIAANDAAGAWHWTTRDQATGLAAEGTFEVRGVKMASAGADGTHPQGSTLEGGAGTASPAVKPLDELVFDAPAIFDLVHAKPVEIVLLAGQTDLRQEAQDLVSRLQEKGVKASLRIIEPSEFRPYPMQWAYETIEDGDIRQSLLGGDWIGHRKKGKNQEGDYRTGIMFAYYSQYANTAAYVYYKDVILLGRADATSNPLLDLVVKSRMLWRSPTADFPAAGAGMVGYAWAPFHYGNDAIVLYGRDGGGLKAAADSLVKLAEAKEKPAGAFVPKFGREGQQTGQVYRSMGIAAAAEDQAVVSASRREAASLLPPVYDRVVLGACADAKDRLCIRQQPTLDANGSTFAMADFKGQTAKQYLLPKELARDPATSLRDFLGNDGRWPAAKARKLGEGYVAAADGGIGLYQKDGKAVWFYDPFPALGSYEEAKYVRRVRDFAISADGKWIVAATYDDTPQQHGSTHVNRPDVFLLDAQSGKCAATAEGYIGNKLGISADGSRFVVLDEGEDRKIVNPHHAQCVAVFDRSGKETGFYPITGPADRMLLSPSGRMCLISYGDARGVVSVIDLDKGAMADAAYPRVDTGAAVSDDGDFAVVCYNDGMVCKLGLDGTAAWRSKLPAAGVPAITSDKSIAVACCDGTAHLLDAGGKETHKVAFSSAAAEAVAAGVDGPPAGVEMASPPAFWDRLPKSVKKVELSDAPFAERTEVTGDKTVTIQMPKAKDQDVVLVCFSYQLKSLGDELTVAWGSGAKAMKFRYGYHVGPRTAAAALRTGNEEPVQLTFSCPSGAVIDGGKLLHLKMDLLANVALNATHNAPAVSVGSEKKKSNFNAPRVMIPNVMAYMGDPRDEQMAYEFSLPKKGEFKLEDYLPGAKTMPKTDAYSYFDGDVYHGTPLYPALYPANPGWAAGDLDLRSAQIVMEYDSPRTISAIGVWDDPTQLPASAWTLECCDQYTVDLFKRTFEGDWRLACSGRNNINYFQLESFKPAKAKVWRYTIVSTPARVQQCAEIELFEETIEDLLNMKDLGVDDGDQPAAETKKSGKAKKH